VDESATGSVNLFPGFPEKGSDVFCSQASGLFFARKPPAASRGNLGPS
jgi:hypothetical protein